MPGIAAAGIIISLILGYIPLSSLLLDGVSVEYSLRLAQYDSSRDEASEPQLVDVVRSEDGQELIIEGMVLEKRYTELQMELRGPQASRLVCEGEIGGDPEQLWLEASGPNRRRFRHPLILRGLEGDYWSSLDSGGLTLWQREEGFTDMGSFLADVAQGGGPVGLAGCDAGWVMAEALAQAGSGPPQEQLPVPLRGPLTCRLIVCGDLQLEVSKRDLNLYEGRDDVTLKLYRDDELVYLDLLEDDGETGKAELSETEQVKTVALKGLEPGLYRLEVGSAYMGNDYIVSSIKTDAAKMVFTDRVYIYDPADALGRDPEALRQLSCYLSSPGGNLTCVTWHPYLARSVEVEGGPRIELEPTDVPVQVKGSAQTPRGGFPLELSMAGSLGLQMPGAGFAFRREMLFDPNLTMLQPLWSSSLDSYSLVLTRGFRLLEETPRGRRFRWEIGLDQLGSDGSNLRLVLLKTGGEVEVYDLKVRME